MRWAVTIAALLLASCANPVQPTMTTAEPPNQVPTARIIGPTEITADSEAAYSAECYDGDGDMLSYRWSFDGVQHEGPEALYTPVGEGTVRVTLEVSDGKDAATDALTLTVSPAPWKPEPLTIYIMDATAAEYDESTIIEVYCYDNEEDYLYYLSKMERYCAVHNMNYPDEPWDYVGGGT